MARAIAAPQLLIVGHGPRGPRRQRPELYGPDGRPRQAHDHGPPHAPTMRLTWWCIPSASVTRTRRAPRRSSVAAAHLVPRRSSRTRPCSNLLSASASSGPLAEGGPSAAWTRA